ncbi:hypothetical protein F511_28753 [Dorcoceras hygrometricum]|uniref:Uncharacterized protein n=1 Tax=Dorcoceras hygrometricum TaxID=472368 RepID=A0A2Z7B1Y7_9LAMI|nr:hypothetical protein F511_28753 [Dorcoceras hygrometricum]
MFIDGEIVYTVSEIKVSFSKESSVEFFKLPSEGILGCSVILAHAMADMNELFSMTGAPSCPSSKKKDMKVEHWLLNDIVAKSLTASWVGSFDVVTTERVDRMVAINTRIKLSLLLEKLVEVDLGESVALYPLKVLNTKSVHTYKLKNQAYVKIEGATKQTGEKALMPVPVKKARFQRHKKVKPLRAIPDGTAQVSIPEDPDEEATDAAQLGSSTDGEAIPENTGSTGDDGGVRKNTVSLMKPIENIAKIDDELMIRDEIEGVPGLLLRRKLMRSKMVVQLLEKSMQAL